jgi:hypothetical protein
VWGSLAEAKFFNPTIGNLPSKDLVENFSLPAVATPLVQVTAMPAPAVVPPVATPDMNMDPVFQEPEENVAAHEGEQ